jgi:hypothetical protein
MNVFPPTLIVPVRDDVAELGATEYTTVPLPLPLPPEVMVMKLSLLTAVQSQSFIVVTEMLPEPPLAGKLLLVGVIMYRQPGQAPMQDATLILLRIRLPGCGPKPSE